MPAYNNRRSGNTYAQQALSRPDSQYWQDMADYYEAKIVDLIGEPAYYEWCDTIPDEHTTTRQQVAVLLQRKWNQENADAQDRESGAPTAQAAQA